VLDFAEPPSADRIQTAISSIDPLLWFDDPHGAPDWRCHVTLLLAEQVADELGTELGVPQ
jgi:hypothetical protein